MRYIISTFNLFDNNQKVVLREGDSVQTFYAETAVVPELIASLADAHGIEDIHIQRSPYAEEIADQVVEYANTKFTNVDEINIIYFE
jgi:hypothetical protein